MITPTLIPTSYWDNLYKDFVYNLYAIDIERGIVFKTTVLTPDGNRTYIQSYTDDIPKPLAQKHFIRTYFDQSIRDNGGEI